MVDRLTQQQVIDYLARIGFNGLPKTDLATLDDLVFAHQCSVPFETLDMHLRTTPPAIDMASIYEKIVIQNRGGYCFEVNYLFEALLIELGFNARPCFGRFTLGRKETIPINHRSVLVSHDSSLYIADVGIGGPMPAGSLKLFEGAEQTIRGETFITNKIDETLWGIDRITNAKEDIYKLEQTTEIRRELEICVSKVESIDFEALNLFFSQTGKIFHDTRIANLRTRDGFIGLKDNVVTIKTSHNRTTVTLADDSAYISAVEEYFGFTPVVES